MVALEHCSLTIFEHFSTIGNFVLKTTGECRESKVCFERQLIQFSTSRADLVKKASKRFHSRVKSSDGCCCVQHAVGIVLAGDGLDPGAVRKSGFEAGRIPRGGKNRQWPGCEARFV